MKRSEMLELIERHMSMLHYVEDRNKMIFEDEYKAEAILKVIERAGMIKDWEPEETKGETE